MTPAAPPKNDAGGRSCLPPACSSQADLQSASAYPGCAKVTASINGLRCHRLPWS